MAVMAERRSGETKRHGIVKVKNTLYLTNLMVVFTRTNTSYTRPSVYHDKLINILKLEK